MSRTTCTARRLLTAEGIVEWPRIVVDDDGTIESIEAGSPTTAEDTLLTPLFFDVHVHGAAGHDVMEGSAAALGRVSAYLASCGVGHFLATTVTASMDATLFALDGIANAVESPNRVAAIDEPAAQVVGIHLEGPFLSHSKRGVHPADQLQPPSVAVFERLQQAARGHIRLMTVAPEVPGALELIEHATRHGVRVSLGHSDATAQATRAAIAAGATSATHTFNAMRPLDHREPGIAGVVLDTAELYAELICDGIHVAPEFVRLWAHAKGRERAILVTDGIAATGMGDGETLLGGFAVSVRDGRCLLSADLERHVETLAGSVLTMDRAVANLQAYTGAGLQDAIGMASTNPARMLGLPKLAEIAVGRPASFNRYSAEGTLLETVLAGRAVRRGERHDVTHLRS